MRSRRRGRGRHLLLLVAALGSLLCIWLIRAAFTSSPPVTIELSSDRPAIGVATKIVAAFDAPRFGLGSVRLELVQGDQSIVLAEERFEQASPYALRRGGSTAQAKLEAVVGRGRPAWLKAGEVTVRAVASRLSGALRSGAPTVVERKFTVRLRPPALAVLSSQHYVRQGGSGVVVLRAGDGAERSGVRVGSHEFESIALPGASGDERLALFGVPWDVASPRELKVFAEDDAGNRIEQSFVTLFKPYPPRRDTIQIDDPFLERVVPAIAAATPGFEAAGSLLDQYLRINGELRKQNLAQIAELSRRSQPQPLWDGPFLQMRDSARRAGYAEVRSYQYRARTIDQQTHLGLDLASTEAAMVPAPNAGVVLHADQLGIYGNAVIIDHGCGLLSLSGHLSSIAVRPGDRVEKGQAVGRTGATGLAGGDHLHLETFVGGISVDPVEWLDAHWIADNIALRLNRSPG